ncbi:MAG TPA: SGNH/GDSL hydrolase family protein [Stellaceae bacterium]|nr:SGNH/GDSL hydrolase family protein [Stellaceae bacterium]
MKLPAACCAALAALLPAVAAAGSCDPPPGGLPIAAPLERFAAGIERGGPVTIVAIGSSSTAGTGATSPDRAYPARLEAELRARFPTLEVRVVNRGKGGEDAPEELARLPGDVVALHPDLAIWQVGTNAVLRRDDLTADAALLRDGVALLKRNGIDVVMMDLQVAPRVLDRTAYPEMERLIAATADGEQVGLFRRFALMRYWQSSRAADAPPMVGPDGLHMTDAGYGCLAADLAAALEANWRAETKLAHRDRAAADAVAATARPAPMRRNDAGPFN